MSMLWHGYESMPSVLNCLLDHMRIFILQQQHRFKEKLLLEMPCICFQPFTIIAVVTSLISWQA